MIGIIYTVIELAIQKYTLIGIIASVLFVGLMIISIYIVAVEISYSHSRKIGGRRGGNEWHYKIQLKINE